MNIQSQKITQILLAHFDEIPLSKLLIRRNLERLNKFFEFSNIEVAHDDAGRAIILCRHGVHKDDSDEYAVNRLELQERKIVYEVEGSSEVADSFFGSLTNFLANLAGRADEAYLRPIVKSEESEIVAHLNFAVESLLSSTYLSFVNSEVVNRASSDMADADVKLASLRFLVEYSIKDEFLDDYRVALSRKEFTVEPRLGYPLAEQIYYSKAPVDTKSHIELLEGLERAFE